MLPHRFFPVKVRNGIIEPQNNEGGRTDHGVTAEEMAEIKHWYGAAPDSWFSHLAVEVPGEETKTEWCEPVSGTDYDSLK